MDTNKKSLVETYMEDNEMMKVQLERQPTFLLFNI
jgi:hypothetical protein